MVPLAYAELAVAKKTAVALKSPSLSFTEAGVSFASIKRYAPAAQRAKMIEYRTWFQERHWPTHA